MRWGVGVVVDSLVSLVRRVLSILDRNSLNRIRNCCRHDYRHRRLLTAGPPVGSQNKIELCYKK